MTGPPYHNWRFEEIPHDPFNRFDPNLRLKRDDVAAQLTAHRWQFARTMPKYPHWYTLRRDWTATAGIPFENVVQFLRDDGYDDYFGDTKRKYWSEGDFKYWTMGWPAAETIVINRAFLDPEAGKAEIAHPTRQLIPKIKPRQPTYVETYTTLAGLRDVLDRLHEATRPLPPKLVEVADTIIGEIMREPRNAASICRAVTLRLNAIGLDAADGQHVADAKLSADRLLKRSGVTTDHLNEMARVFATAQNKIEGPGKVSFDR